MKMIFLDIDGVLNSPRSICACIGPSIQNSERVERLMHLTNYDPVVTETLRTIDPISVELVNMLIEEDMMLVLSSSHRTFLWQQLYGSPKHLEILRYYLMAMGIDVPENFNITPELSRRANEVRMFMDYFPCTHYVILDDHLDFNGDQNHIPCDPLIGLTYENYVKACNFLDIKIQSII